MVHGSWFKVQSSWFVAPAESGTPKHHIASGVSAESGTPKHPPQAPEGVAYLPIIYGGVPIQQGTFSVGCTGKTGVHDLWLELISLYGEIEVVLF